MAENYEHIVWIEAYLEGSLSPNALAEFEQKMENEPEFAALVALYKDVETVLDSQEKVQKKQEWLKIANNLSIKEDDNSIVVDLPQKSNWKKALQLAAVFLVFALPFGMYFLMNSISGTHQLAWEYYQQPETLAEGIIDFTRSGNDSSTQTPFEKSLEKAEKLYAIGKMKEAIEVLEKAPVEPERINDITFLKGRCYFMIKQNEEAKKAFRQVAKNSLSIDDQARWMLALTYLQNGEEENAKSALQEIIDKGEPKAGKAKELLKKNQSIKPTSRIHSSLNTLPTYRLP